MRESTTPVFYSISTKSNSLLLSGPLLDTPYEEGVRVFETNFFGCVRLVKNVVPRMGLRGRGTVVVIGSIIGELATPFQAFYNSSKAALHMYAETLRMECRVIGVKVVLVAPGAIKSNIAVVGASVIQWCIRSRWGRFQKSAYTLAHDSFYKGMEKQIKRTRCVIPSNSKLDLNSR